MLCTFDFNIFKLERQLEWFNISAWRTDESGKLLMKNYWYLFALLELNKHSDAARTHKTVLEALTIFSKLVGDRSYSSESVDDYIKLWDNK